MFGLRKAGMRGCEREAARPVRPSRRAATASFICPERYPRFFAQKFARDPYIKVIDMCIST